MAVADVIEAMASHRPYAGARIEKALAEIERGRGTAYDPKRWMLPTPVPREALPLAGMMPAFHSGSPLNSRLSGCRESVPGRIRARVAGTRPTSPLPAAFSYLARGAPGRVLKPPRAWNCLRWNEASGDGSWARTARNASYVNVAPLRSPAGQSERV